MFIHLGNFILNVSSEHSQDRAGAGLAARNLALHDWRRRDVIRHLHRLHRLHRRLHVDRRDIDDAAARPEEAATFPSDSQ